MIFNYSFKVNNKKNKENKSGIIEEAPTQIQCNAQTITAGPLFKANRCTPTIDCLK
jgi:hypothetical protein